MQETLNTKLASAKVVELVIDYQAHPNQNLVHQDPHKYRIVVAGRRFGKTTIAIIECIQVALSQAYSRVWYLSPTYRQAEMIAWKLILKMLPKEVIKRQNNMKLEIELFNGSIIELKGAENEDNLRGVGLNFAVLDEYAFMKPHIWGMIIQPMFATTGGRALFIGTPDGKNHFYQMFLEGLEDDPNYKSFQFKSVDSPYVDKEFIETEQKRLPPNQFRQEYEACFEDFTGLIFPEFTVEHHIIEPFNIPTVYNRVHALDPAISTGTTAALFTAIDKKGNIIIYDEYYESNLMASAHAQVILGKYDPEGDLMLIDPHAASKTIQREGQFFAPIDEYRAAGINPRLGESHLEAGINHVRECLKVHEDRINPYKRGQKQSPSLFVFDTCVNFIHEVERYRYADRPESKLGLMKATPYKKDDHLCVIGSSKIHTVKGDMPIKDLVGKTGYLYAYNGERICVSRFSEVRKTGKDKEVWRVTYTDGNSIKATPDHPFMLRTGEYKPLKSLVVGDSLMPFYKRIDNHGHELVILNNNKRKLAHRLVYEDVIGNCDCKEVHHINEDKTDNRPENLRAMSKSKHCGIHAKKRRNPSLKSREKMSISHKRRFYNKEVCEAQKQHLAKIEKLARPWHSSPEGKEWHKQHGRNCAKKGFREIVDKQCLVCGKWFKAYKTIQHRSLYCHPNCRQNALRARRNIQTQYHNHKIASIEFYGYEDVYNMEVEGTHNYACDGVIIHNCDCIRYICMSRPGKTVIEKKLKYGEKSLYAFQKRDRAKTQEFPKFK